MDTTARPLFALYIVWHPSYANGSQIADLLRRRFGGDRYQNITGDPGVSVLYRSEAVPDEPVPLPINWDESDTTAVVVLADTALAEDTAWVSYVRDLAHSAQAGGFHTRLFPVMMEPEGHKIGLDEQALRWDQGGESDAEREQRLVRDLTYEFSRMLRHRLALLRRPEATETPLADYLEKIRVFLSHSKHDDDGETVARSFRDWLHERSALSSFFDIYDIPAGLSFRDVLLQQIGTSAVVALHTDSYSSREWCRREVIEAKRRHVPMIVVDCLHDADPRGMPYMGNVPIVRMNPEDQDRLGAVIEYLLDEVFRDFMWRCRIESLREASPDVLFMARPPELIALATLPDLQGAMGATIVYPDPLLSTDEAELFSAITPQVRVLTLTEWLEENQ